MNPVTTLFARDHVSPDTLPSSLATLYDGGFSLPRPTQGRPYVIANFVETIDGVVSYNAPGQKGGGVVSGDNKQDQMVMGLLRAFADAVVIGTSSLREDANHLHIPSTISPDNASAYAELRTKLGKQARLPMTVVLTASGDVNFDDNTFHTDGLKAVVLTTEKGQQALSKKQVPRGVDVHVVPSPSSSTSEKGVSPAEAFQLLAREYAVSTILYEGGPHLLSSLLQDKAVDELFVTVAPHLAGHVKDSRRFSLLEGREFQPDQEWAELESVKLTGSHLLLRYKFK